MSLPRRPPQSTSSRALWIPSFAWPLLLSGSLLQAAQTPPPAGSDVVSGRVVNARTGAPMARVLVQANAHSVFTNADGHFQLSDTAPITSVQFTKPGFSLSPEQRDPTNIAVAAAADPLEISLWPEAVLVGTITSPEGEPLPRIAVTAQRVLFGSGVRQIQSAGSATTDAHGAFRLPVPAGSYSLQTRYAAPDFSRSLAVLPVQSPTRTANDATGTLSVASGQELRVDLHPQLAAVVHVTIPLDAGTSQRSPAITITTPDGASYQPPRRTSAEGLVLDLPAGVYQLAARLAAPDGERADNTVLTVPDHDVTAPVLHLEPLPTVPIVLSVDPASAANPDGTSASPPDASALNLQLEPLGGRESEFGAQPIRSFRGSSGSSFLVPAGSYRLSGGDGGGWTVEAATSGNVDLLRTALVVGSNVGADPIHVVVGRANGTLSGVTRIAGRPAACWIIFAGDSGTLPRFFVRRSESSGQFNISGLPLRPFRLLALPLLSLTDFGDPAVLDQFQTYVQTISVTASSASPLTLDAVPVHELYP